MYERAKNTMEMGAVRTMRENDVRGRKPAPRFAPETETGKA